MNSIVLVPGSQLGAWAWQPVADDLRSLGFDVHALTLTGFAERAHLADRERTDFTTHVTDVASYLEVNELSDVVLVGHSYAGAVVTAAAAQVPDRIGRLVYVAGLVPENGMSLFDQAPDAAAPIREFTRQFGDGWLIPLPPDEILNTYYGKHELEGEVLERFRRKGTPHPIATYEQAVEFDVAAWKELDRVYVRATGDLGSPVDAGTPGWTYAEIQTGHWPMFTKPAETAELLGRIANRG
jgi:pimeloyl-ACP methyl ester carboxylesterase